MSFEKACKHLKTVHAHRREVRKNCFRMGLYRQGLMHDLSKYSWAEFRIGAKYFMDDQSPHNGERAEYGFSSAWLHHKGRNKHHFEYWIDYGINCDTIIKGVPIPRKYVAEMVADRISASRVYLGDGYNDCAPYEYWKKGRDRLWFVDDSVKNQLDQLLRMLAEKGEDVTVSYIRHTFLKGGQHE